MKKIFLLILLTPLCILSQEYSFDYELDYRKANKKTLKNKIGKMRISLENSTTIFQIFKPNEFMFAVIRDIEKKQNHYFYYISHRKKGEKFRYIGTTPNTKGKSQFTIHKISNSDYPEINYIVKLDQEFGNNNLYYINNDSIYESKNEILIYKPAAKDDNIPAEIELNPTVTKPTTITLPEKLKHISFSHIQELTKCVIITEVSVYVGNNEKQISNTCY